ncbi:MAG: SHOCT domain-containing protein [Verrucomicrobiota bacterium]
MIVKCPCQHCDAGIEFDAEEFTDENSVVPCPHCGLETKLFVNENFYSESSASFVDDKPKSLLEPRAVFKAYSEANEPKGESELKELVGFLKNHETSVKVRSFKDELELAGDKIIIRRRGLGNALAAGLNGERMILISSLTAIQLKLGGWLSPGYILFSYAGSKPFAGGIFAATEDPDAFIFEQALNDQVTDFKVKVEKIMRESKQAPTASNSSGTLTDELRKLAEFKQQGILSQEEFDAAKKKLLA